MLKALFLFIFLSSSLFVIALHADDTPRESHEENAVTMINLGSQQCLPCKMMVPVIEKLREDYKGRVEIRYVDIVENRAVARQYRIHTIPAQIFFDRQGKEVYRHIGFLDHASSSAQLDTLLSR